ncbi:MAG TPA: response regulator transcription factor [Isosphaeraceae bacterium]|jgi:DNA-binding response OmpR family regulator|nr:response regulator transcription factor [Isosphaeraceae bacterium]
MDHKPMERRGRLLLVEDEHVLRTLVAQFLRAENYHVVEAADGPEGVARFGDSGPFDLALVDLNLPIYSGVEVCRRIKRTMPGQRIMICSAAIMCDNELALQDLGIDHFLTKPYHPEELLAHIDGELRLAGTVARGQVWGATRLA